MILLSPVSGLTTLTAQFGSLESHIWGHHLVTQSLPVCRLCLWNCYILTSQLAEIVTFLHLNQLQVSRGVDARIIAPVWYEIKKKSNIM